MTRVMSKRPVMTAVAAFVLGSLVVEAHLITYRGTVARVEAARVQVKTLDDQGREEPEPRWFVPTAETRILRGSRRMTLADAKITTGERIVVTVDHRADDDVRVVEIRLAERSTAPR